MFVTFLSNASWHIFKLYPPSLVYRINLSWKMVKFSINFKTGILRLMPSVPTFENGIPRCTCSYFHEHFPWIRRENPPLLPESFINQKKMQLNLANCALTAPVIYRTFSGISFRLYRVLDFEVTQPSKFTINLRNEVRSETKGGLYASAHRIIISSSNCNCLCNLGLYCFLNAQTLAWSLWRQLVFFHFN